MALVLSDGSAAYLVGENTDSDSVSHKRELCNLKIFNINNITLFIDFSRFSSSSCWSRKTLETSYMRSY